MSRRRVSAPSRLGTMFLLLGCCTVLGGTFALGIVAGRYWPELLPALGRGVVARREPDAARGRTADAKAGDRARATEPAPVLTFYQELTAPLTAPPPPVSKAKAKSESAPPPGPRTTPPRYEPILSDQAAVPDGAPVATDAARRFTVQVGAFNQRGPADALRATLAGAGYDPYVTEVAGPAGPRYRVRVGAFASREEASRTAGRLAAERKLATYVTLR